MEISSLPTGNFYKMVTIFGLFLIIYGITWPEKKIYDLEVRKTKLNEKMINQTLKWNEFILEVKDKVDTASKIERLTRSDIDSEESCIKYYTTLSKIIDAMKENGINQVTVHRIDTDESKCHEGNHQGNFKQERELQDKLNTGMSVLEAKKDILELKASGNKILNDQNFLKFIESDVKEWKRISWFLRYLGFIIMFCGFFFWYHKIQKFEDLILKKKTMP